MRIIIFLIVSLITTNVFSAAPDEKLHNQCLYPTVIVVSNEGSSGTGVIIRSEKINEKEYQNVVITCNHVLSTNPETLYRVFRGEYKDWSNLEKIVYYDAVVYDKNSKLDLSILFFSSAVKMPVAELGTDLKTYIGTEIFKIGCGGEEHFRLDYGKITALNKTLSHSKGLTRTSAYTLPGDSGGPVFQEYKLIGIINSIKIADSPISEEKMLLEHISYFVPISSLVEWNKQEKRFDFIFDSAKELPKIEFAKLQLLQYEIN